MSLNGISGTAGTVVDITVSLEGYGPLTADLTAWAGHHREQGGSGFAKIHLEGRDVLDFRDRLNAILHRQSSRETVPGMVMEWQSPYLKLQFYNWDQGYGVIPLEVSMETDKAFILLRQLQEGIGNRQS